MVGADASTADDDTNDVANPDPRSVTTAPHANASLAATTLGGHIHGQ